MANIVSLLLEAARATGDKPLLVQGRQTVLGYGALDRITGRLAARLRAAGGAPGDRIVVQVDKSSSAVILYLASLRAGLIYVPIPAGLETGRVGEIVVAVEPRLIVCRPHDAARTRAIGPFASVLTLAADSSGSLFDGLPDDQGLFVVDRADDDLACILYRFGPGMPKGVMLSHGSLTANGAALLGAWRWRPDDVLIHALPLDHGHGLVLAMHGALLSGATILFHPAFDAAAVLADLPRATVFMGVPAHYARLLEQPGLDRWSCATMRLFLSSPALAAGMYERFARRTCHRILERYGIAEAGLVASNPYGGTRVGGTVGYALPGVSVRITDNDGFAVDPGRIGVLEVKGPSLFAGYWRDADASARAFRPDGHFITGDMAMQDSDGRITLVGHDAIAPTEFAALSTGLGH